MEVAVTFSITYLHEPGFSVLSNTEIKETRTAISVEKEIRVSLSTIYSRLERLCDKSATYMAHQK
jgi:hypothetical protein